MFKSLVLAAFVAISFAGALLTSAAPAAADALDDAFDSVVGSSSGAGAGKVSFDPF